MSSIQFSKVDFQNGKISEQIEELASPSASPIGRRVAVAALKILTVLFAVLAAFFAFVSANLAIIGLPVVWGGLVPTGFFTAASIAAKEAYTKMES